MSSSSLTAMFSSDAPLSDKSLPLPPPTRPTAQRTYGRRREPSPQPDADTSVLKALFTSSDPVQSASIMNESPSKALLNRFASTATGWMSSLGGLGMEANEIEDEATEDAEALKREMAKLKEAARAKASSSRVVDLPPPSANAAPRRYATPGLHATSSTSTLTTLPTSPLRSSPPPRSSAIRSDPPAPKYDVDTRPLLSDAPKASSQDMDLPQVSRRRSSSPASDRSITPTPATKARTPKYRSVSHSPSLSPVIQPARKSSKGKASTSRLQAFMADLESDEEPLAGPSAHKPSSPKSDAVNDFLATLQSDDDDEETADFNRKEYVRAAADAAAGLFDDEEEDVATSHVKGKKVKSLAKKEVAQMHKDVAAAKRDRQYHPFKPDASRLPISSWAMKAHSIIKAPLLPSMVADNGSEASSPMQVTPDEITAFTPSSAARSTDKPSTRTLPARNTEISSPTKLSSKKPLKDGSDDESDVDLSLAEKLDRDLARLETRDAVEAKRQILKQRKEATLRALKWQSKAKLEDSDDELSIAPKPEPTVRFVDVKPTGLHRTAKSVLDNFRPSNAMSKNRQAVLKLSGRKSSPHEEVTETMADFAGKTFKHANLKASNGGARPAGQKSNREVLISQNDLNALTMAKHQKQAQLLRMKKEAMFNVKRKNNMPPVDPKAMKNLEVAINELVAREVAGRDALDEQENAEAEDGEDDDFEPSGSEADEEEADDGEVLQYSGDEDNEVGANNEDHDVDDGDEDVDRTDIALESETDGDKENQPLIPETSGFTESHESCATPQQSLVGSARPKRTPLGEVDASQPAATPRAFASTFVDVAGFCSGGGSPGFSQLFEATQAAGPSGAADAFAALRDQHEVLLPTNALLPQVEISKTQIERDNAMIAADGEGDAGDDPLDERPKTQYLNDKGFFTQTRPLIKHASEVSRNARAGSSVLFDDIAPEAQDPQLSSTQKGTSEDAIDDDQQESPHSNTPSRRHSLAATENDEMEEDEEIAEPRPVNAFSKLMSAGQRPLSKHQQRAKRMIKSNLVDEQAEESDEDDWMIGGAKSDDEEENDGEDDAYLAELVNDEAVSEEEKRLQDDLAAAKAREINMADDAKREAAARKITEGEYRHKRRGKDFWSDDEDGSPRKKRWSKKERRARKAWKEDGLEKLDGEQNVFHDFYDKDLDSDIDSVEEMPTPRKAVPASPKHTHAERLEMLRRVARMNKAGETASHEIDLDEQLFSDCEGSQDDGGDTDTESVQEEFFISRSTRILNSISETVSTSSNKLRSAESYQAFVRDESQLTRRATGAIGAASVVYNKSSLPTARSGFGKRPQLSTHKASAASSSSGGSILMSKTGKFA